jgi:nucleoside-diphosphate-sugar epimerase
MKALITGASGYLGQRLATHMAESGTEVIALIRTPSKSKLLDHPNITVVQGDLTNRETIHKIIPSCNKVFHLAAYARFSSGHVDQYYKINLDATRMLLDASWKCGVKKFVFCSTAGVLGHTLITPLDENSQRLYSFTNNYDLSKYLAEKEVLRYADRGMDALIVSPTRIYGPGIRTMTSGVNQFIEKLIRDFFVTIPQKQGARGNYGYIDDIVDGHLLAMEKGVAGEKYILGGENISYEDLIRTVKKFDHNKNFLISASGNFITLMAYLESIKAFCTNTEPQLTPELASRIGLNFMFDCSKSIRDLGYRITPFEEGIQKTIHYLLEKQ